MTNESRFACGIASGVGLGVGVGVGFGVRFGVVVGVGVGAMVGVTVGVGVGVNTYRIMPAQPLKESRNAQDNSKRRKVARTLFFTIPPLKEISVVFEKSRLAYLILM